MNAPSEKPARPGSFRIRLRAVIVLFGILVPVGMGLWSLGRLKRPRHGHEKDGLWQLPDFVR